MSSSIYQVKLSEEEELLIVNKYLADIKSWVHRAKEAEVWRELGAQPKIFSQLLEDEYPRLSRRLLGGASNIVDPYVAGMGLEVLEHEDTSVRIRLPYRWKNKTYSGEIPLSAVSCAAEYCLRLFWERHLDPLRCQFRMTGLEAHLPDPILTAVDAQYDLSSLERERVLFELNSQGHYRGTADVPLFNPLNQRVGLMEYRIEMSSDKALPGK